MWAILQQEKPWQYKGFCKKIQDLPYGESDRLEESMYIDPKH